MSKRICSVCKKEILPNTSIHGMKKIHWHCHEATRTHEDVSFKTVKDFIKTMDRAMNDLKKAVKKKK